MKRWAFGVTALVCAAGLVVACAPPSRLYARRPRGLPPNAGGATLAVLPTVSLGSEQGPAVVGTRAAEAIFAAPIGGARFRPPSDAAQALAGSSAVDDFLARLSSLAPPNPEALGQRRVVFRWERAEGVDLGDELVIRVREGPALPGAFAPPVLDTEIIERLGVDWVLASAAWAGHQQVDEVLAVLGILPLIFERRTEATEARGLFALYRAEDGSLAWEAFIGGEGARTGRVRDADEALDPRMLPFVIAAQLLTGSVEEPVARAWSAQRR